MGRFCPNCGAEQLEKTHFCGKCGYNFDARENQSSQGNNQNILGTNGVSNSSGSTSGVSNSSGSASGASNSNANFNGSGSSNSGVNSSTFNTTPQAPQIEQKSHNLAIYGGYFFSVMMPVIGIAAGIYLLTRENKDVHKHGILMILISVLIQGLSFIINS